MSLRPARTVALTSALTARDRGLIASNDEIAMDPDAQHAALRDAAHALHEAGIAFALIGGIAVSIRSGQPRASIDVHLAVVTRVPRATATSTLTAAGFEQRGEFAHSVNFRHANGEPVQLAFDAAVDPAIAAAEPVQVADVVVPVVSRDDLIAMKERAGADPSRRRSKALRDQADVALLRGDVPDADEGW